MGRPVGGAGAGCGAVGLLGLLLSVGIVVWLGSQAFDGVLGGGDDGPETDGSAVAELASTTTTTADPTAPVADAMPLALLGDGLPVRVGETAPLVVQDATPGTAAIAVCSLAGVAPGAVPPAEACGPAIAGVDVGADGRGEAAIVVPGSLGLADREVDCRAESCALIVRSPDGRTAVATVVLAG